MTFAVLHKPAAPVVSLAALTDEAVPQNAKADAVHSLSRHSRRGLDGLIFFVADIQTGFGPFVAVFLTTQKWTQVDIGLVLTVSGLVSLFGQVPLGALVDSVRSVRATAFFSLVAIGISAFAFAAWPIFPVVLASRMLHAAASCTLGLSLVSISLGLIGSNGMSERLGRNAAFASAGTAIAAGIMGACGYYFSNSAVFFLAGMLVLPAIFSLSRIRAEEIGPVVDAAHDSGSSRAPIAGIREIFRNRALVVFALCVLLFHLANAAMLPLAASSLALHSHQYATLIIAAAIVVPQFTVTLLSPWIGRVAHRWGRRLPLLLGFGALALRGILFAATSDPHLLVAIQILDGLSAAALSVLVPLTIVDLTRKHGHFNLAQGAVGCGMGIGAAISTTLAGLVSDRFGNHAAFDILAACAVIGFLAVALAMPETRPLPEAAALLEEQIQQV
ncbi:MAG TPA: MFS transporter [Beijerinckiaceae bacterium]|nr:MFS transporter [Beijerinckiaceae bacterium]